MSKGKDIYSFSHEWIQVLGHYCQEFSLPALALLSSVWAVSFTLRQVVYLFVCFSACTVAHQQLQAYLLST